ncbi:MAG: hypothetical protein M3O55_10715 [Actinomycetota bacterium]|nr:hypothetical protein [Actinomycetota bacterium]
MSARRSTVAAALAAVAVTLAGGPVPSTAAAATATTTRVSVSGTGVQGNQSSSYVTVSANGRYVAFTSSASNLVPGDTNNAEDVFVRDRMAGTIRRVDVPSAGGQANGGALGVAISADGRFVAYGSDAANLVPGDTNVATDVFVRDRANATTTRVSVSTGGVQGNNVSYKVAISADGRFVAFGSSASNLVPGDTNGRRDVFVRDRTTSTTTRVNVSSGGAQANQYAPVSVPSISADGRYVAFESTASNLTPGDTNATTDVFVRDRVAGTTARVSLTNGGGQANLNSEFPSVSADGRYVAFESWASNLVAGDTNATVDVFVRDRSGLTTRRVDVGSGGAQANGGGIRPAISADGRFVAFESSATNLIGADTNGTSDVFVRDRTAAVTRRVSVSSGGGQADSASTAGAAISADGRYVPFISTAANLVPGDTNGAQDAFLRDRGAAQ